MNVAEHSRYGKGSVMVWAALTEKLTCTLLKTEHRQRWGIAMRFSISLWGHMRVLSVQNLFWWTIMPVPTVHTSLTPIWNVRNRSYGLACSIAWPESDSACMKHSSACNCSQICATKDFTRAQWCIGCWMEANSTKSDTDSDYANCPSTKLLPKFHHCAMVIYFGCRIAS